MFKYSVSVVWSDEDACFVATAPELQGLSAFGETQEEAITEFKVVGELYVESLEESGEDVPEPYTLDSFSGQLRLRMPKSLHAKLSSCAKQEEVSLNMLIVSRLSEWSGQKDLAKTLEKIINKVTVFQSVMLDADNNILNVGYDADEGIYSMFVDSTSQSVRRQN